MREHKQEEKSIDNVESATEKQQRLKKQGFQKGQSGNTAGKKKGTISIVTALKRELEKIPDYHGLDNEEKKSWLELIVRKMLRKGVEDGDVAMLKDIVNRVDGMPKETLDIQSKGERIGGFNFIRPEDDKTNDKTST